MKKASNPPPPPIGSKPPALPGPPPTGIETLKGVVARLKKTMQCNCDLDRWEPEPDTGHSWVCRIHKAALREIRKPKR